MKKISKKMPVTKVLSPSQIDRFVHFASQESRITEDYEIVPLTSAERAEQECIDGPTGCSGPVKPRWPGYGANHFIRCELHAEARIEREQENRRRYLVPELFNFDPSDAGEEW